MNPPRRVGTASLAAVLTVGVATLLARAAAQQNATTPPPVPPPNAAPADPAGTAETLPLEPDDSPAWEPLADDLARVLEAKSAGYARRALKFSCRERIREAEYEGREARRESVKEYDYLLVSDPTSPGAFDALRSKPGANDPEGEKVDLPFPEPYLWSQLFDPKVRSLMRFRVGAWHTTPWKLAIPVQWAAAAPVLEKRRITEWSGTIEVEYATGNIVRVVARPTLQDERIVAELERYLVAFRFMGFSTSPPPEGLELIVEFDAEHEGFTYPSRVELVTFRQVHRDERQVTSRRVVEYGRYRFFGTKVQDEIPPLRWRAPDVMPTLPVPPRREGGEPLTDR